MVLYELLHIQDSYKGYHWGLLMDTLVGITANWYGQPSAATRMTSFDSYHLMRSHRVLCVFLTH